MQAGFIEEFGDRWQEAVNRRAAGELLALCAEDIRIEDPGLAQATSGHVALRAFFAQTWSAFPDLRFSRPDTPYLLAPKAPIAVARWIAKGTMGGRLDPPGYAPTNSPVEFHGIDIWEFNDNVLTRWEGIYDVLSIARQIGALPPQGSAGERVGALVQRIGASRMRRKAG
jgi:predicted ester cyclase